MCHANGTVGHLVGLVVCVCRAQEGARCICSSDCRPLGTWQPGSGLNMSTVSCFCLPRIGYARSFVEVVEMLSHDDGSLVAVVCTDHYDESTRTMHGDVSKFHHMRDNVRDTLEGDEIGPPPVLVAFPFAFRTLFRISFQIIRPVISSSRETSDASTSLAYVVTFTFRLRPDFAIDLFGLEERPEPTGIPISVRLEEMIAIVETSYQRLFRQCFNILERINMEKTPLGMINEFIERRVSSIEEDDSLPGLFCGSAVCLARAMHLDHSGSISQARFPFASSLDSIRALLGNRPDRDMVSVSEVEETRECEDESCMSTSAEVSDEEVRLKHLVNSLEAKEKMLVDLSGRALETACQRNRTRALARDKKTMTLFVRRVLNLTKDLDAETRDRVQERLDACALIPRAADK